MAVITDDASLWKGRLPDVNRDYGGGFPLGTRRAASCVLRASARRSAAQLPSLNQLSLTESCNVSTS